MVTHWLLALIVLFPRVFNVFLSWCALNVLLVSLLILTLTLVSVVLELLRCLMDRYTASPNKSKSNVRPIWLATGYIVSVHRVHPL
jgi:hypothetical protein